VAGGRRIVIVGGGFGGAYCARRLAKRFRGTATEVRLIDRRNYLIFYPLLVEAGTGSLEPRHTVVSLREFVPDGRFMMAEVTDVDLAGGSVRCHIQQLDDHIDVAYDYLVLSPGSVTRLPDVSGLSEHAQTIKSLADAVALRDHAIAMLEVADAVSDPDQRRDALRFVVVGANFTGVEVAGEYFTFLREASKRYRNIKEDDVSVILVELEDRILSALPDDLSEYALRKMKAFGIDVRLEETVTRIGPNDVHLRSGGRLATQSVIWCAGIAPAPLIGKLDCRTDDRGYLETDRDLRVPGCANIWAIGDSAVNRDAQGTPYPPTAQHAVRQAKHAATDIVRVIQGRPTRPCNVKPLGSLAAIGCRTGVAKVLGVKLSGFAAWWLYRTVYLVKMPGLARKLRLLVDWTMALFFRRNYVQLSTHSPRRDASG